MGIAIFNVTYSLVNTEVVLRSAFSHFCQKFLMIPNAEVLFLEERLGYVSKKV